MSQCFTSNIVISGSSSHPEEQTLRGVPDMAHHVDNICHATHPERHSWVSEQKVPSAKVGQLMTRQWLADPVSALSSEHCQYKASALKHLLPTTGVSCWAAPSGISF